MLNLLFHAKEADVKKGLFRFLQQTGRKKRGVNSAGTLRSAGFFSATSHRMATMGQYGSKLSSFHTHLLWLWDPSQLRVQNSTTSSTDCNFMTAFYFVSAENTLQLYSMIMFMELFLPKKKKKTHSKVVITRHRSEALTQTCMFCLHVGISIPAHRGLLLCYNQQLSKSQTHKQSFVLLHLFFFPRWVKIEKKKKKVSRQD